MNNENEIRSRILTQSRELFYKFGYSKITMEEIASGMGISKKTLYKHFSNKEHLLKEIVHETKCEIESYVDKLIKDRKTEFITKLKSFMEFVVAHFSRLSNPLVQDLVKNQPAVWKDIQEFRKKNAYDCFSKLIMQGIENGIFRKDIHCDVVALIYFSAVNNMLNAEVLSQLPFTADQAYNIIVSILFEGIFTTEGRKKYKSSKYLKTITENN